MMPARCACTSISLYFGEVWAFVLKKSSCALTSTQVEFPRKKDSKKVPPHGFVLSHVRGVGIEGHVLASG